MLAVCKEICEKEEMPDSFRQGIIGLIKKNDRTDLKN